MTASSVESAGTVVAPRSIVRTITPFDRAGNLDGEELLRHLRRMLDANLGVYLGSVGGGEGQSLALDDYIRLYNIGVQELKGKVAVWASGFEPRTAAQCLEVAQEASRAGIEAFGVYPIDAGHGYRPTPRELEYFYETVLDGISIPVVVMTSEATVGYEFSLPLLERLVGKYPRIFALNMYNANLIPRVHRIFGTRLKVYAGDMNVISNLALGGHGFSGSEANIAPHLCRSIVDHWVAGNAPAACAAFADYMRLRDILRPLRPSIARAVKAGLQVLDLPGGYLRPPYLQPEQPVLDELRRELETMDIMAVEQRAAAAT
jgi:4-hydroxy-tetrahydrodipicolinate synthase